ncbi:MAG: hypothetical protein ABH956_02030 [Candidatus Nealsonbacteria bacterium]
MNKEKDFNNLHKKKAKDLFPPVIGDESIVHFLKSGLKVLKSINHNSSFPWVSYSFSDLNIKSLQELERKYI